MNQTQRAAVLGTVPILAVLDGPALDEVASSTTARRYRRGQILFTEGDIGDSLLVVTQGQLKAYTSSPEGEELLLSVLGPGESMGEVCLADGGTRSATVEALTTAEVLRISRQAVMSVAATTPALTEALLSSLAAVVRRLTGSAADLVFLDLPRRVAKVVLDEHFATGLDTITLPLTQADIASSVGASRQSVNAALRDFQRRGWISTSGRTIEILDRAELSRYVGA